MTKQPVPESALERALATRNVPHKNTATTLAHDVTNLLDLARIAAKECKAHRRRAQRTIKKQFFTSSVHGAIGAVAVARSART